MDRLSEEEILNSKLDEERMLEIIEDLLQDPFHYFSKTLHKDTIQIYALSISVLKDLYKAEKEKNKELERYKRIASKKLDDIEKFRKNECNHRCIKNAEVMELKEYYQENYISKDKIKEKIEKIKEYRDIAEDVIENRIIIAENDSLNYGRKVAHQKDIEVLQELLEEE